MMKKQTPTILSIVPFPFLPPKKGGDWCAYYTCHFLAEEWPMLVATPQAPPYPANFQAYAAFEDTKWKYLSYDTVRQLVETSQKEAVGALFLHQPFMGPMAYYTAQRMKVPLIVYVHNLEYQRFQSMGKPWWHFLYYWEKWLYQRADLLLFISDEEMNTVVKTWHIPEAKCLHTPYGVLAKKAPVYDASLIKQQLGFSAEIPLFLFFGSMTYSPNVEAVKLLLDEVLPRWEQKGQQAQWVICGGGLPQALQERIANHPQMQYMGFVPALEPYIQAADIMVNPVLSGGGVKTKVMEALNWGTTVVSTHSGALGINRQHCQEKLLTCPDADWEAFANQLQEALPQSAQALSQQFYEQYAWEQIMGRVGEKLALLLG